MTTRFHFTNNAKWFTKAPFTGAPDSERMFLWLHIHQHPGTTSAELQDLWPFKTSMRSRLKELHDSGYLRAERISDIFA